MIWKYVSIGMALLAFALGFNLYTANKSIRHTKAALAECHEKEMTVARCYKFLGLSAPTEDRPFFYFEMEE